MAHELDYNSRLGRHAFFSVKEPAWHKLGIVVDNALTSEEAIKTAGLDFTVIKTPNFTDMYFDEVMNGTKSDLQKAFTTSSISQKPLGIPDNRLRVNPDSFSTIRTDTREILGTVGSKYTVFQNNHAFDFFDDIVKDKLAIFETAGSLFGGRKIFITAKLPTNIIIGNDDVVNKYLLLTNSHDGSSSIEVMFTNVRVVCNNTLTAALSTAQTKYKVRHTENAKARLDQASRILNIELINSKQASEIYNAMTKVPMTDREVGLYINKVFLTSDEIASLNEGKDPSSVISSRKQNVIDSVYTYYFKGAGQDLPSAKNTLWGAYNAITGYFQNVSNYKNDEVKMESIYFGDTFNKTNRAFDIAVKALH